MNIKHKKVITISMKDVKLLLQDLIKKELNLDVEVDSYENHYLKDEVLINYHEIE